jgi:hypothetical protein
MWGKKLKTAEEEHVLYDDAPKLDHEVINTWDSLNIAETIKKHEWKFNADDYAKKDDPDDAPYDEDPDLDDDVVDTQSHLKDAQENLNHVW